jgi:hypothetical protein
VCSSDLGGRTKIGSFFYYALNIFLALAVLLLVVVTKSWIVAIVLTIVSKWRVFTVRPIYWWANIQANLVDIVVGISFVFLIYYAGSSDAIGFMDINWLSGNSISLAQMVLTGLYIIWLTMLKTKSQTWAVNLQALVALFLGLLVASMIFGNSNEVFLVLIAFIVGYGSARHALLNVEGDTGSLDLLFGLLIAELAWIQYHWLFTYDIADTGIKITQLALIGAILGFCLIKVYTSVSLAAGKFKLSAVFLPILFSSLSVALILLLFSNPIRGL